MCLFVTILPILKLSKNTLRLSSISTMILLRVMTILPKVRISIMSMHHLPILSSSAWRWLENYPEDGEIEDDVLREKLSKINLLIDKIEDLILIPTSNLPILISSHSSTSLTFSWRMTNTFDEFFTQNLKTFCLQSGRYY
ncbi:hypothetical protein Tco_0483560 [Tanacetum coccineum]